MNFLWGLISQGLVQAFGIVESKVFCQPNHQLAHRGVAVEVHIFMLDAPPKPLHKDVVIGPTPTVHADRKGLAFENVRGVSFQPVFGSGRNAAHESPTLNTADVILGLIEHSGGTLTADSFTPLPCGDPNCATIGYLLKIGGTVRSISDFVDFSEVQDFLRDKVRYSLDDLAKCGCENEPLAELLKRFELDASHTFRLFVKPFMDSWTWDQDRIDRCCTHVITPSGALDSFCRYYGQSHE